MLSFCECDEKEQEDDSTFPSYRHIYGMIGCIVGTVAGWFFYRKLKFEGYLDGYLNKILKKCRSAQRNHEEVRSRSVNVNYTDSNSQTVQLQASPVLNCDNIQGEHSSRVGNISRKRRRRYV